MDRERYGRFALSIGAAILLFLPTTLRAQDPNYGELLAKLPALDPTDEKLTSFEFDLAYSRLLTEVSWSRANGAYVVYRDRTSRIPLVLQIEGRMLFVDASTGTAEINEGDYPILNAALAEERISLGFGNTEKQTKINVDPASLLREGAVNGSWEKRSPQFMRYRFLSPSGNSRATADFDPTLPYPLLRMDVYSLKQEVEMIALEGLRVNEPLRRKRIPFPAADALPAGMVIRRETVPIGQSSAIEAHFMVKLMLRLTIFAAIDDEKLRGKVDTMTPADWETAKANRDKYGPVLLKLFDGAKP